MKKPKRHRPKRCLYYIRHYSRIRSFTTSAAIISPATDGTNATLPGIWRRVVHRRVVPGGQTHPAAQLASSVSRGVSGFSRE